MGEPLGRRGFLTGAAALPVAAALTATTRPAAPRPAAVADPRSPVFDRTGMHAGTAFFWSRPITAAQQPAFGGLQALGAQTIRFQSGEIPATLGGTGSPAAFTGGIQSIQSAGAVPFIGVPPTGAHNWPGGSDPWSYAWQQWVVQVSAPLGCVLYEMANEPNNYGGLSASQYFSQLWSNVPRLKAYARSLGHSIYFAGPATTNFCSRGGNLPWVEAWLGLCQQQYAATGNHDWIPDMVSVHCYGGSPASPPGSIPQAMAYLSANFDRLRTVLNKMAGPVPGSTGAIIKCVNSEYNIGIHSNIGTTWQSQATMSEYFGAIFQMASSPSPVDGQRRVYMMNQFCITGGGGGLDLLSPGGTPQPAYSAFRALATALPAAATAPATPTPTAAPATPAPSAPTPTAAPTPAASVPAAGHWHHGRRHGRHWHHCRGHGRHRHHARRRS